jgi:H+-transporting ATPase
MRADVVGQNIIWFVPLDLIKFGMKATVIKYLRDRHEMAQAEATRARETGIPIVRTQSRAASIHESLYSNRTSFIRRAVRKVGFGQKVRVKPEELQRFSSIQAHRTSQTLARHPSRTGAS